MLPAAPLQVRGEPAAEGRQPPVVRGQRRHGAVPDSPQPDQPRGLLPERAAARRGRGAVRHRLLHSRVRGPRGGGQHPGRVHAAVLPARGPAGDFLLPDQRERQADHRRHPRLRRVRPRHHAGPLRLRGAVLPPQLHRAGRGLCLRAQHLYLPLHHRWLPGPGGHHRVLGGPPPHRALHGGPLQVRVVPQDRDDASALRRGPGHRAHRHHRLWHLHPDERREALVAGQGPRRRVAAGRRGRALHAVQGGPAPHAGLPARPHRPVLPRDGAVPALRGVAHLRAAAGVQARARDRALARPGSRGGEHVDAHPVEALPHAAHLHPLRALPHRRRGVLLLGGLRHVHLVHHRGAQGRGHLRGHHARPHPQGGAAGRPAVHSHGHRAVHGHPRSGGLCGLPSRVRHRVWPCRRRAGLHRAVPGGNHQLRHGQRRARRQVLPLADQAHAAQDARGGAARGGEAGHARVQGEGARDRDRGPGHGGAHPGRLWQLRQRDRRAALLADSHRHLHLLPHGDGDPQPVQHPRAGHGVLPLVRAHHQRLPAVLRHLPAQRAGDVPPVADLRLPHLHAVPLPPARGAVDRHGREAGRVRRGVAPDPEPDVLQLPVLLHELPPRLGDHLLHHRPGDHHPRQVQLLRRPGRALPRPGHPHCLPDRALASHLVRQPRRHLADEERRAGLARGPGAGRRRRRRSQARRPREDARRDARAVHHEPEDHVGDVPVQVPRLQQGVAGGEPAQAAHAAHPAPLAAVPDCAVCQDPRHGQRRHLVRLLVRRRRHAPLRPSGRVTRQPHARSHVAQPRPAPPAAQGRGPPLDHAPAQGGPVRAARLRGPAGGPLRKGSPQHGGVRPGGLEALLRGAGVPVPAAAARRPRGQAPAPGRHRRPRRRRGRGGRSPLRGRLPQARCQENGHRLDARGPRPPAPPPRRARPRGRQ
mmetsp:Transcript_2401/g.9428  ORF Transcript_2401/g.9428 Transcript_2401/m.9428 type:complete len:927 (-) Transcript_2401:1981-4761(-)